MFHDLGFRGNTDNYYDPRNSYLNDVMDRRTGLPIALSALTMAVGRRAGLEIAGVGLPGHFMTKMIAGTRAILFDPFNGGRILSPNECAEMLERVTGQPFTPTPKTFQPVPLGMLARRMLNNLKMEYLRSGDFRRAIRVLERLRSLIRPIRCISATSARPWFARDRRVGRWTISRPIWKCCLSRMTGRRCRPCSTRRGGTWRGGTECVRRI